MSEHVVHVSGAGEGVDHDVPTDGQDLTVLYLHCPACGMNDIFVAILPLETEFAEDYEARREAMEKVVRGLHAPDVEAVVVPLKAP